MITLRPDLKTAGGEVTELLWGGRYVGTMTLVYRENGRLSGSVQLERDSLEGKWKLEAVQAAQNYVERLTDALGAEDCEVIVTWSSYEHIITAGHRQSDMDEAGTYGIAAMEDDDAQLEDVDPDEIDTMQMDDDDDEPFDGELVIVGESRNRVEYHIYGLNREWLAEAFVRIRGADVLAEIDWKYEPGESDIESATELLVSDFDPDEVDTFYIEMIFDGELLETVELTHEDLLESGEDEDEDEDEEDDDAYAEALFNERDYSVILVRDDGDTLTYDLYKQSHGGLPIGQATVDVSRRELTGFIDFLDPDSLDNREMIGSLLMRELDKEKDYDSLNLSMLVHNELIDDIWYETETYH